ncbi:MAG TPA: folylpolyglutamate synthase/dihydrofolate synthase family protein [Gemmatimonadales bacterium]
MGLLLRDAGATPGYGQALDFLFRRTTGAVRLGLDHTRRLLAELGDPHLGLRSVHVAGTNGKGSTAATLEALLRARGLRVGKYTSPHLVDFRERIVVDGVPMPGDDVVGFVETHLAAIERTEATFFEVTTAMALEHFARSGADIAVIETGLGGRLDSTNVVMPLAAVVTTIGLDHTEYLGPTLRDIAREKAGIFKPGVPAVVGEPDAEVAGWLAAHALDARACEVRVLRSEGWPADIEVGPEGTSFTLGGPVGEGARFHTPLVGRHQAANTATALLALDALGTDYALEPAERRAALENVRVPGRFERAGRFIFDVAHNPDGAEVLTRTLSAVRVPRPLAAVVCVLADKDWRAMLSRLAPHVDVLVLTQAPTAPANRAWDPVEAAAFAASQGWAAILQPDFDAAIERAATEGATVLVTGSFHTVGDAMARLPAAPAAG